MESTLRLHQRSGTDEAHLTDEYIYKLRKLVRARFAKPRANGGNVFLGVDYVARGRERGGTLFHRAEFDNFKRLGALADALLQEKRGSVRIRRADDAEQQQDGRKREQRRGGEEDIQKPLYRFIYLHRIHFREM